LIFKKGLKMKKLLTTLACIAATGCASITEGTTQPITVNSNSPCSISRNGMVYQTTPEQRTVWLKKSKQPLTVDCGGKVQTVEAKASKAALTGALFLDFGIVDMLTGAFWKYPEEVSE
jgi:hypothetical protein